ncbi:hypothetical protein QBC47DRAFT_427995 [Echria macrotheca]|uniref:Apple domain-containing protein n=1 Tax=Echria macrotheca TaxID=438768 RepID=A0AAJ0FET4_9PEZI|nr:hypothetical protein QBC47DRAFT_427995 [Echria macrotheca]
MFSIKMLSTLVFAVLAIGVTASPAPNGKNIKTTATSDIINPTCTDGIPASKQRESIYPIDNYTLILPEPNMTSYQIAQYWYDAHYVSGPHIMSSTHGSDPYGPFKCQYICNANSNCTSFFVSYENPDTEQEHMNCACFNGMIDAYVFEPAEGNIGGGGYDKLCSN